MLNQSTHNSIEIDEFDKQILFHLSKGTLVEDMPQYIPISLNAIKKRKLSLKELLKVKAGTDEELVKEAKAKGFFKRKILIKKPNSNTNYALEFGFFLFKI